MCGIVGFTGKKNATDILMEGLSRLEYRGYDSAGIAVQNEENIIVMKAKGHLEVLYEKLKKNGIPEGNTGIGHTRWATHGEPSEQNAHPHVSSDGKVALVHNGIIENDKTLREMLGAKGYTFSSETDTETAVNLIAHYYSQTSNPHKAIESAMQELVGSYAFAILFFDIKGALFAARNESPLIIGLNENGHFLASDIPAILSHTHLIYHMENQEFAEIRQESVTFFHKSGQILKKTPHEITWNMEIAEKNGYPHFMLKEIHEQPRAVRDTIHSLIKN
jgi:glucosamine--fructose-6-phosphate aminotransferase (isomerizing)